MRMNSLKPAPGSKPARHRVGRGVGSGWGKTAGLGHKGQRARAGGYHKVGFEGGQMPLHRRLPKRGFVSLERDTYAEVRLSALERMKAEEIDLAVLKAEGVVPARSEVAKVILSGKLSRKVLLKGVKASKGARSAIGTLVERSSRYVILLHLPHGRTAEDVRAALTRQISKLPAELRRTLTWDQGKEMADHVRFATDTNMQVYFCDPHSPWQRGSNENTNGLLRQYFPKNTDLSLHSVAHLNAVARQLNNRPRQTLGWMKPCEVFSRAVASIG